MTRGISLWLDFLRVAATLVVVLSHLAYPRFTRGDYHILRDLNLGSDAVIVFFVISGLVIAYAAERDKSLPLYAFNRLTRLLSVVLPALVLTFLFDQIGYQLNAEAYPAGFYQPHPLWEMLLRGATFSNEWAVIDRVRLGTNGPLWSLSYEAGYYLLFGAAFFLHGARRAAVLFLLVLLLGPRVLILMPAWLFGAMLWRFLAQGGAQRINTPTAWIFALGGPLLYTACQALHVPGLLVGLTATAFEPFSYHAILVFSDEFIWNGLIGILASLHILGMAHLLAKHQSDWRSVRWLAGASFSIYVTHYPMLHLMDAAIPEATPGRDLILLVASIAIGLIFASLFERRIRAIRDLCQRLIPNRSLAQA